MPSLPARRDTDEAEAREPTIVIAHHMSLLRHGLRHVLDIELPGCRVIETERMAPTVALLRAVCTELLLVGLGLPGMNGHHSLQVLRSLYPRLTIGVVSQTTERAVFAACVAAGVNAYIHVDDPIEEISYAITTMLAGRIYVTPSLAVSGRRTLRKQPVPLKPSRLTPRQQEVLRLLEQGAANKEIARTMSLSESTVKIHLAAIYRMLGVRNRTEAVVNAGRERA